MLRINRTYNNSDDDHILLEIFEKFFHHRTDRLNFVRLRTMDSAVSSIMNSLGNHGKHIDTQRYGEIKDFIKNMYKSYDLIYMCKHCYDQGEFLTAYKNNDVGSKHWDEYIDPNYIFDYYYPSCITEKYFSMIVYGEPDNVSVIVAGNRPQKTLDESLRVNRNSKLKIADLRKVNQICDDYLIERLTKKKLATHKIGLYNQLRKDIEYYANGAGSKISSDEYDKIDEVINYILKDCFFLHKTDINKITDAMFAEFDSCGYEMTNIVDDTRKRFKIDWTNTKEYVILRFGIVSDNVTNYTLYFAKILSNVDSYDHS